MNFLLRNKNINCDNFMNSFTQMVDYSDLGDIEPQKTIVSGVEWIEGHEETRGGEKTWIPSRLIFPPSFNGEIETDVRSLKVEEIFNKIYFAGCHN